GHTRFSRDWSSDVCSSDLKQKYGTTSSIPSSAFFYGLKEQTPVEIEIERGKTLEIKLLGRSEAKEGIIDLFVELNGQLRLIQVRQANQKETSAHPQADQSNPKHRSE